MPIATAQQTLELHTGQFVDSLAGAPPIYTCLLYTSPSPRD